MSYENGRIEIALDGTVTVAGNRVGMMTFDSLAARMTAVGDHFTEGQGPETDAKIEGLEIELEVAEADAERVTGVAKEVLALARAQTPRPEWLRPIIDKLEEVA